MNSSKHVPTWMPSLRRLSGYIRQRGWLAIHLMFPRIMEGTRSVVPCFTSVPTCCNVKSPCGSEPLSFIPNAGESKIVFLKRLSRFLVAHGIVWESTLPCWKPRLQCRPLCSVTKWSASIQTTLFVTRLPSVPWMGLKCGLLIASKIILV